MATYDETTNYILKDNTVKGILEKSNLSYDEITNLIENILKKKFEFDNNLNLADSIKRCDICVNIGGIAEGSGITMNDGHILCNKCSKLIALDNEIIKYLPFELILHLIKDNAKNEYDNAISHNLENMPKWSCKLSGLTNDVAINSIFNDYYKDPDEPSEYYCEIDSLPITLSQDGLCSARKIWDFNKNNFIDDYKLIREEMFDTLIWPVHRDSINQKKALKSTFNDRLDLTLIDIELFYSLTTNEVTITPILSNKLIQKCHLGDVFINAYTFYWLKSFKNFREFIEKRNLQAFVGRNAEGGYTAEKWTTGDSNAFDKEYYDELISRVKKYRKNKGI